MTFSEKIKSELAALDPVCSDIKAMLRAAFLQGGTASIPEGGRRGHGYHLEFASAAERAADDIMHNLAQYGIFSKKVLRGRKFVVYLKGSGDISDALAVMGAARAVMELNNSVAARAMRNRVQRGANCIQANIDKAVDAAARQKEAAEKLSAEGRLGALAPELMQAAGLRLAHPDATIAELAGLSPPPVTKNILARRLKKLVELAGQTK